MDLDRGVKRSCYFCGRMQSEQRCLEYNDHFFCSLRCKQAQENQDDANLSRPRGVVIRFNEH